MSFNKILKNLKFENTSRFILSFNERHQISKSLLDKDDAVYIKTDEFKILKYDILGPRYAAFTSLSYDAALTLYNVDKKELIALRLYNNYLLLNNIISYLKKNKIDGSAEARLFGFNTNLDNKFISATINLVRKNEIEFYEVDILGNEIRNIALDLKTGQTFNILMNNRLYKPGELINKQTLEEFEFALHHP
ncbi:MAG: hypothetical protein ACP5RI_02555 [Candidatus Micrarchaeia archaeon]